jgi:N-acyl-D-amino-acid deacylase
VTRRPPPLFLTVLLTTLFLSAQQPAGCDLLISGGRIVDGTGAPWFLADVCVAGDRIAAVRPRDAAEAKRRIDATGLVVAPGFIDMLGQSEYWVLRDSRVASKIMQGITTELTGEASLRPSISAPSFRPAASATA